MHWQVNKDIPLLVSLQDIDNLLEDASDQGDAHELKSLGFVLGSLEELKSARGRVRAAIDAGLVRAYDRLATVYRRRAVVPIVHGTCSGCYGTLPTARLQEAKLGDKVLCCENCGRILFWM
jgi:hypothetical protein